METPSPADRALCNDSIASRARVQERRTLSMRISNSGGPRHSLVPERTRATGSFTTAQTHHTRCPAGLHWQQHSTHNPPHTRHGADQPTPAHTRLDEPRAQSLERPPSSSRGRELGSQRPRRLRSSARRGGEGGGRRRRLRAVLARELAAQGPADRGLQPQCTSIRAGAASVHQHQRRGPRSRAPRAFACGRYEGHEGNECS